jgi:predicted kinase
MAPRLIVVTGPPASGKTVLAELLAAVLALPLLAKDDVKLALFRTLGASDMAASMRLSMAAVEVLFAVGSRVLAAGGGLILEGNLVRGQSEAGLRPLLAVADTTLQIHCSATREETLRRYSTRPRHEMHFDEASLPRVLAALDGGRHDALDLGVPTLHVDTTAGYQPPLERIMEFARI